ncbi:hypothetical protein SAMN05878276_2864 [Aquipseudomonas alcaligenes]|nr:hypothetical protein SAMN05878276_2864 [Pseudomonas alcaligenes]
MAEGLKNKSVPFFYFVPFFYLAKEKGREREAKFSKEALTEVIDTSYIT